MRFQVIASAASPPAWTTTSPSPSSCTWWPPSLAAGSRAAPSPPRTEKRTSEKEALYRRHCFDNSASVIVECMGRTALLPSELTAGPFTLSDAIRAGLNRWHLEGANWRRVGPNVYVWAGLSDTPELKIEAA